MRDDIAAPKCPKRGWVILGTSERDYVVPTTCKTWGCQVCRNKVRQLTALKMMFGCLSTGGPSLFITLTYRKRPGDRTRNARSVAMDWAALWRRLKEKEAWRNAAWVKVPELTKAGQVHLHGIVVMADGKDTCRTSSRNRKAWMEKVCSANCLEHDLARTWYDITGDSFIVDCQIVRSVAGTAGYVQKYMSKSFQGERAAMESLGFGRRWSASRNWPRCRPIQLQGTEWEAWQTITRIPGWKATQSTGPEDPPIPIVDIFEDQEREAPWLMEKVGGDYYLELRRLSEKRKAIKEVMKGFGIAI